MAGGSSRSPSPTITAAPVIPAASPSLLSAIWSRPVASGRDRRYLGLAVTEAILQANDQIDAVYAHDDDMAEGVVAAIENAGREDDMFITGARGSCTAFDRIEEGGLYGATYLYSPTMAGSAVNMARLIAQGRGFSDLVEPELPSLIVVPPTEVIQDNVGDLRELCFE
jgi:ribose transport system substrate-binding protein